MKKTSHLNIGAVVWRLREIAGLSREDLAGRVGFTGTNLFRLEKDQTGYRMDRLVEIAAELGVSVSSMVREAETGVPGSDQAVTMVPVLGPDDVLSPSSIELSVSAPKLAIPGVAPSMAFVFVAENNALSPIINTGDSVVIDPFRPPKNNDLVLAYQADGKGLVLRRLHLDVSRMRLVADYWRGESVTMEPGDALIGTAISVTRHTPLV